MPRAQQPPLDTAEGRADVRAEQEAAWIESNQAAIASYNRRVSQQGLLSDEAGQL